MRILTIALGVVGLSACSKSAAPPPPPPSASEAGQAGQDAQAATTPAAAPGARSACPATGHWAACSLVYHLDRAGLAPRPDSGASPAEHELGGQPLMLKIGERALLELHIYPDSAARAADEKKLNRADFVSPGAQQTMRRERTLIESDNVLGLLTSLNDHQRERVSDAITAGPPQPERAVRIGNPAKSTPR